MNLNGTRRISTIKNVLWTAVSMIGLLLLTSSSLMPLGVAIVLISALGWIRYLHVTIVKPVIDEERQERIDLDQEKRKKMVHTVEPSIFTLTHSRLRAEDLRDKTFVDQPQHWAAWAHLFIDPMAERPREPKKTDTWIDRVALSTLKGFILVMRSLWLIASGAMIPLAFVAQTTSNPEVRIWVAWTIGVWAIWTVLWGAWSRRIWLEKRHVITDKYLAVIIGRYPFEDPRAPKIPLGEIQSATLIKTFMGGILGYWVLEIEAKGNDDPAISVLMYVKDGPRVHENIEEAMRRRLA